MTEIDINYINEILPRYCENRATDEERSLVEEWMTQSPDNRRIVRQMNLILFSTDVADAIPHINSDKAFLKVRNRMIVPARKIAWWQWTQRVAALLFVPLFIGWLAGQFQSGESREQMIEIHTHPGMTTSVVLPDSTVVYLNSESSLRYPSVFTGKERKVMLSGEGYFAVTKDPRRHFIVSTPHRARIEVLGTRFNVEAYEHDSVMTTTLVEGKVDFLYMDEERNKKISLKPGEKLVFNSKDAKSRLYTTNCESEVAWKDNKLVFSNTPLSEVLRMLGKRFNVEFRVNGKHLENNSFTGTFTGQRLERILEYFQISSKLRWRYIDDPDILAEKTKIEIY